MKQAKNILCASALAVVSQLASAATNLVVEGGELIGATGVNVNGFLYDVSFSDGSCISLFGGCTSPSQFAFTDRTTALAASQVLLDTVFLDSSRGQFDTSPATLRGCESSERCFVFTPFGFSVFEGLPDVAASVAINEESLGDYATPGGIRPAADTSDFPNIAYAVFTAVSPVPEPARGLLLVAGLLAVAVRSVKLRQRAV